MWKIETMPANFRKMLADHTTFRTTGVTGGYDRSSV